MISYRFYSFVPININSVELDSRIFWSIFWPNWFTKSSKNAPKHPVDQSRHSSLKFISCCLEIRKRYRVSYWLIPYSLLKSENCPPTYPRMFSTDFIFNQQENLDGNQKCQAGFRPLCNKILLEVTSIKLHLYTGKGNDYHNNDLSFSECLAK